MNNLIKRHSYQRLKTWDYSNPGRYFITICCSDKKNVFNDEHLRQNAINIFKFNSEENNIKVNGIVVAVDHIHVIVELNEGSSLNLSQYLGKVKVRITQYLRKSENIKEDEQVWQRSFYDHVIRDERDFIEKAKYVENHPIKEEGNIFTEWH